jgi:CelD/BcsL family acetyltransferase involved in cellulose biosynthesis
VYNSGLNPAYLSLSPGWVLLSHLIQWAIENDRKEFDFLRGDEKYKYRFGGVDRYIARLTISR